MVGAMDPRFSSLFGPVYRVVGAMALALGLASQSAAMRTTGTGAASGGAGSNGHDQDASEYPREFQQFAQVPTVTTADLLLMLSSLRRRAAMVGLGAGLALGAIFPAFASEGLRETAKPFPSVISARLSVINYLNEGIAPLFINEQWASGARKRSYSSGTCCVAIPSQWQPGMTMKVSWSTDTLFHQDPDALIERDAPVLPYKPFYSGYVWAVILPGGEVFLQPSNGGPGLAGFLQGLPAPHENPSVADFRAFIERNKPEK